MSREGTRPSLVEWNAFVIGVQWLVSRLIGEKGERFTEKRQKGRNAGLVRI